MARSSAFLLQNDTDRQAQKQWYRENEEIFWYLKKMYAEKIVLWQTVSRLLALPVLDSRQLCVHEISKNKSQAGDEMMCDQLRVGVAMGNPHGRDAGVGEFVFYQDFGMRPKPAAETQRGLHGRESQLVLFLVLALEGALGVRYGETESQPEPGLELRDGLAEDEVRQHQIGAMRKGEIPQQNSHGEARCVWRAMQGAGNVDGPCRASVGFAVNEFNLESQPIGS